MPVEGVRSLLVANNRRRRPGLPDGGRQTLSTSRFLAREKWCVREVVVGWTIRVRVTPTASSASPRFAASRALARPAPAAVGRPVSALRRIASLRSPPHRLRFPLPAPLAPPCLSVSLSAAFSVPLGPSRPAIAPKRCRRNPAREDVPSWHDTHRAKLEMTRLVASPLSVPLARLGHPVPPPGERAGPTRPPVAPFPRARRPDSATASPLPASAQAVRGPPAAPFSRAHRPDSGTSNPLPTSAPARLGHQ
jgi:hypothetical protein